jgi:prepilin-type processing-associated H-X9-DG protein
MSNQKQIMLGWKMYPDDNNDLLPPNDEIVGDTASPTTRNWVAGRMDLYYESTNSGLEGGTYTLGSQNYRNCTSLAPYVPNPGVYKCPADPSTQNWDNNYSFPGVPRVRSYSMSCAVGTVYNQPTAGGGVGSPVPGGWLQGPNGNSPNTTWLTYGKAGGIITPGSADLWVLIEEHCDSINDGSFAVEMTGANGADGSALVDMPGSYHNGSTAIAFADGHVEFHHWIDSRTKPPISGRYSERPLVTQSPANPDSSWLQMHTSAHR